MTTLDAIVMGAVQGLAEFLPISSSGHLEICREILGLKMDGAESLELDIVLHVATVLSTLLVLWNEFVPLCKSFFTFKKDSNTEYVLKILLSCLPVAVVGLFFKDSVEQFFGSGLLVVGICLFITALLLAFSYFHSTLPMERGHKRGHDISWRDAFVIGCAQAVAVLPGLSRSGTTIATGLLLGDNRSKVAQFSFFMVIIPILGEALLSAKDLIKYGPSGDIGAVQMLAGFIVSFLVGCIACKWMIEIVKRGKLIWFSIYCAIVAAVCLIYSI